MTDDEKKDAAVVAGFAAEMLQAGTHPIVAFVALYVMSLAADVGAVEVTGQIIGADQDRLYIEITPAQADFGKVLGKGVRHWFWDTMLAAHVLDNRPGICGLKFQAFVNLGEGDWDSHLKLYLAGDGGNGKNRIHEVDLGDLLEYCGLDSLFEHQVAQIQMKKLGFALEE